MSTIAPSTTFATRSKRLMTTTAVALTALVAVAVAVVFLALAGSSTPTTATHHSQAAYAPLIQFRGDGAPPQAPQVQATASPSQISAADDMSVAFSRPPRLYGQR